MDVVSYLKEIEYAATTTIKLVWDEYAQLKILDMRIRATTEEMERGYKLVDFLSDNPDLDDDNLGTYAYYETYFGPDKDRYDSLTDRHCLEELIAARAFSTSAQSGTLLQYGKQGISIAYGNPANSPGGRRIGTQFLKEVIWQARNHALHWEERNAYPPVRECFEKLAADFGPQFREYQRRNLAFEVVELLRWTSFDAFRADMLTLA